MSLNRVDVHHHFVPEFYKDGQFGTAYSYKSTGTY